MSTIEIDVVTVNIMGREFKIKCPPDKTKELEEASDYLNNKMQEIQHGDKSISIDRVAIAAALNISHELMSEKQNSESRFSNKNKANEQVATLKNKIILELES